MLRKRAETDFRIMLHSGRLFDLSNPDASVIEVEDIAHGLAHTCRYAGQCDGFYSVAEHSVLVSRITPTAHLQALFHDAAEAFVGDMVKPLKRLIPQYVHVEKRVEQAIFERLEMEWPVPDEVKAADYSVMAAEQHVLMPPGTNEWLNDAKIVPAKVKIHRLMPKEAKAVFLERYLELTKNSGQANAGDRLEFGCT